MRSRVLTWIALAIVVWGLGPSRLWADNLKVLGTWPSFRQGSATQVEALGEYAYVAAGGLQVLSISNPAAMKVLGGVGTNYSVNSFALHYPYAVAVDGASLWVADISDPAEPKKIGVYAASWGYKSVVASWPYAYATLGNNSIDTGLAIFDLTQPETPAYVKKFESKLAFVKVKSSGSMLYALQTNSLRIYNLAAPTNPVLAGSCLFTNKVADLAVEGERAYVVDDNGLQVLDVSDPANPTWLAYWAMSTNKPSKASFELADAQRMCYFTQAMRITVDLNYAYIAYNGGGLQLIDIRNPAQPTLAGRYQSAPVNGVATASNCVLMAKGYGGIEALDTSSPANIIKLGACGTELNAGDIALVGHYACLADQSTGIYVVDIANPKQPTLTGKYAAAITRGAAASGNYLCTINNNGFEVLAIDNEGHPNRVGHYSSSITYSGLTIAGNVAYLIQDLGGWTALDISDPTHPAWLGWSPLNTYNRLIFSGNYALVSTYEDGIMLYDFSNMGAPQKVSAWPTLNYTAPMLLAGQYAYFAYDWQSLKVMDLSSPTAPSIAKSYVIDNTFLSDMVYFDHKIYLSGDKLSVLDVRLPSQPQPLGAAVSIGAGKLAVNSSYICLSRGQDGLTILNNYVSPPTLEAQATTDGFAITITGLTGKPVRIQRSTDLQNWQDWTILESVTGTVTLTDPAPNTGALQYYRVATELATTGE